MVSVIENTLKTKTMYALDISPDRSKAAAATYFLYRKLTRQLPEPAAEWVEQAMAQVWKSERHLFSVFSRAASRVGKDDLRMSELDASQLAGICPGWEIAHWSTDQAARTMLLLACLEHEALSRSPHPNLPNRFRQLVQNLFDSADVSEMVALYQSLPLLPDPESYSALAVDGLRSSMTIVFEAIALRNPYPACYFDEPAWNQMVLKALFEGSSLSLIRGLDERANPQLARMLSDYAHERWAANRPVDPELWRAVGPFADAQVVGDLVRVLVSGDTQRQAAAALACWRSPVAKALLSGYPDLQQRIQSGDLTWENFKE